MSFDSGTQKKTPVKLAPHGGIFMSTVTLGAGR